VDHLDFGFEMSYDVLPLGVILLGDIESGTIEDHLVDGWPAGERFGPVRYSSSPRPTGTTTGRINQARYRVTRLGPGPASQVATPTHDAAPVGC